MKLFHTVYLMLTALLAACNPLQDSYDLSGIKPGSTRSDEVRQRYGPPAMEFADNDGGFVWEYSRQPEGRHCYMVGFDRQGIATSVRQVLTQDSYRQIRDGMQRDEIRRMLGKPASIVTFSNLSEEVWEWHVEGDSPLEDSYFDVHFDLSSGGVKRTSKRINQRG